MSLITTLLAMLSALVKDNFQVLKPSAQIAKRVRSVQLDIAIHESRLHFLGAIASVSFVSWVFYQPGQAYQLQIWWGCAIPLLITNYVMQWHIYKKHRAALSTSQWEWIVFFMYAGWGALWALAPWLFLPGVDNPYVVMVMMLILIAVCVTVIIAAAAYPFSYLVLAVPIQLSSHVYLMSLDLGGMTDRQQLTVTWLIPFFAIFLTLYMLKFRKTLQANTVLHLENEQANINKSQFLAAASHDIRQPLQASIFYWENLKSELEQSSSFEKLGNCLNNLSDLLDNILDVSRLDAQAIPNNPRHIELQQVLSAVARNFAPAAEEKGIVFSYPNAPHTVFADPILLERIIFNLVSNAISYTQQGSVNITCVCEQNKLLLTVADTGIGIPRDEQEAIFDEFYQLDNPERDQRKGLGLGLAIVKRISHLMKCPLSIQSKVGEGTRFTIELALGEKEQIDQNSPVENVLNENLSILLIDDEEIIRDSLQSMLLRWNMQCESFESAADAIGYIARMPGWIPDCIISDYRLKENQTGTDAIATVLHRLGTAVPAILLTGDTHPERIQEAHGSGYAVVHKPIKPAYLRTAISIATSDTK